MVKGKPYQCNSKLSKREQIMKQKILEPRMATVQLANLQDDPLETLPSFKVNSVFQMSIFPFVRINC